MPNIFGVFFGLNPFFRVKAQNASRFPEGTLHVLEATIKGYVYIQYTHEGYTTLISHFSVIE